MSDNIRILVSENNKHIQNSLISYFSEHNMSLAFCNKDGNELLEHICNFSPDVVLCDVFLKGMDAIDMRNKAMTCADPPRLFFITSSYDNENIIHSVINAGFDYYFIKPYSPSSVYDRINSMLDNRHCEISAELEAVVTDILYRFKIPAHIKGYKFHRDAIMLAINNPDIVNNMTKQLYPQIAQMHSTTAARVERAMRTAVEIAWERADVKIIEEYFSYHIHNFSRPSNSEFIASIADRTRIEYVIHSS